MKIWLTSDTHFCHGKMLEYCYRPQNYEELIEKNFKLIESTDVLIHLGDICIGKDEFVHDKYIKSLPCKKILVKGNHDRKTNTWYLNNGWDFVCDKFIDNYFGKSILFSHRPYEHLDDIDMNIHGHMHNMNRDDRVAELNEIKTDKHVLISIEYTNYRLVQLRTLVEWYDRKDRKTQTFGKG